MSEWSSLERRLLIVTESLGIGGTEKHLTRTLPKLVAEGWKTKIFCLSGRGKLADEAEAASIEVLSSTQQESRARGPGRIAGAGLQLFRLMRRWRPHIVHFYLPRPYLVGAPVAVAAGVPLKLMSRRSLAHYRRNRLVLFWIERLLHRQMDAVTANAQALIRELLAEGVPQQKIRLIYNGIDTTEALPDREACRYALSVDQYAFLGVVVANLHRYKGHRDLIEGFASIASKLPPNWRLLCVGRDEGMRAELASLIESLGLAANIQLIGERANIADLLAAADISVLTPTENEGFSNAVLESMAAGLPLVVSDCGGNAEAVVDGETGFVVPIGNAAAIGSAVLRIATDADLRTKLGASGRRRVEKLFSLQRCVASHAALYDELLAARSECLDGRV